MYAVIAASGRQFRVSEGDTIVMDRQAGAVGEAINFERVLLLGGDSTQVGTPTISGAVVKGEILDHSRGKKVLHFKMRRRHRYRRLRGFRRSLTSIKITGIDA